MDSYNYLKNNTTVTTDIITQKMLGVQYSHKGNL